MYKTWKLSFAAEKVIIFTITERVEGDRKIKI